MLTEDYITEVYCFIDDMMKECWKNIRKRGPGPKLSDAEVITMEIAGESLGMDCDKTIHRYFRDHWRHLFPNLGTRTTFCDRRPIFGESSRKFGEFCSPVFCRMAAESALLMGFRCRSVVSGELIFQTIQGRGNLWILCRKSDDLLRLERASADRFERNYC